MNRIYGKEEHNKYIELSRKMMKAFCINVRQIIGNSDNTYEDMCIEAYIIVHENYEEIMENNRVFINKLKQKCLKNNKYGVRIESKNVWEKYNNLEESIPSDTKTSSQIEDDRMVGVDAIKGVLGEEDYQFLLCYFDNDIHFTARKYDISENNCRVKACRLKRKINREV